MKPPVKLVICPFRCGWSARANTSKWRVKALGEHYRVCRVRRAQENRRRQLELALNVTPKAATTQRAEWASGKAVYP